jgi:hypothetical protein
MKLVTTYRFYTKEDSGCYDPDDDAFLDSTQNGEICLTSPGLSKDQYIVMRKAERVLMYVILIEYSNVAAKNHSTGDVNLVYYTEKLMQTYQKEIMFEAKSNNNC